MDVLGVYISTSISIDVQCVPLSTARSIDEQSVFLSATSSLNRQGVPDCPASDQSDKNAAMFITIYYCPHFSCQLETIYYISHDCEST